MIRSHSVEGQVSRTDERYLFLNVFENNNKASISLIFMVKFTLSQCN